MDGTPKSRARRRARQSAPAEAEPLPAPAPVAIADEAELLEDHTRPIAHHRTGRRLGVSLPGAILGVFLITALALGASLRTATVPTGGAGSDGAASETGYEDGGPDADEPVDGPDADQPDADQPDAEQPDADQPVDEPVDGPDADEPVDGPDADEPIDEPVDEPDADEPVDEDPTPAPPVVRAIEIGVGLNDGHPVIEWSACRADGFVAYKVVRSTDNTVTYPRADNDTTVAIVENASTTRFVDVRAPAGKKLFYRVFALANRDGKQVVVCVSRVEDVTTPRPEPDPTPKPEPDPTPKPEIGTLGLTLSIKEGVPYVDWTECKVDGDFLYKVVRSKDAKVTWPLGDYDSVVAAVGGDGPTAVFDEEIGPGKKVYYRVFCLRALDEGYKVLAASAVKGIETPADEPDPLPEPTVMGFEVEVTGEGIVLHWEQCTAEQFAFYKVIRSRNPNPSYLPSTEGSIVVAAFENGEITQFVDGVDEGGTWYYRVQSIGYADGQKFLLGQTPVRSVTIE